MSGLRRGDDLIYKALGWDRPRRAVKREFERSEQNQRPCLGGPDFCSDMPRRPRDQQIWRCPECGHRWAWDQGRWREVWVDHQVASVERQLGIGESS